MNYRKDNNADREKLQQLGLLSYGQHREALAGQWPQMEAGLKKEGLYDLLLSTSQCFTCEHENEIIGMAFLVPSGNPWDIYPADTSYIRLVGVHPSHSGKGIARKLTAMCIDAAKALGEKTVMLHTSEFMDAAKHIYESVGFKKTRDIGPRFGKAYYLYCLELKA
jgi:ribosomal protein S18 acetylase RimI-like enzyme